MSKIPLQEISFAPDDVEEEGEVEATVPVIGPMPILPKSLTSVPGEETVSRRGAMLKELEPPKKKSLNEVVTVILGRHSHTPGLTDPPSSLREIYNKWPNLDPSQRGAE